jgi:hypothetical protein
MAPLRETDLSALVRHFSLSPLAASSSDWHIALYLFLLTLLYALPLWVNDVWHEIRRSRAAPMAPTTSWPRLALQGIGCGLAVAAILVLRSRTSLDFIYFHF